MSQELRRLGQVENETSTVGRDFDERVTCQADRLLRIDDDNVCGDGNDALDHAEPQNARAFDRMVVHE